VQTALQNFRQTLAKAKRALTNPAGWDGVPVSTAEAAQLGYLCCLMGALFFAAVSS
jgi:hypothetical protein